MIRFYAIGMYIERVKKVVVLTPTIGKKELAQACQSVAAQTYENVEHLVVVDGSRFSSAVDEVWSSIDTGAKRLDLPYNTGGGGFYGHRIIAGFSKLIDADYIAVLDEDNWIEPRHIETLVGTIEKLSLDFAFSLRNYCNEDGLFLAKDNCESIGEWEVHKGTFIDTNAYLYTNKFIRQLGHLWDFGWAADRRFFKLLLEQVTPKPRFTCTGHRTLNYRLAHRDSELVKLVTAEVIEKNEMMRKKYGTMPWTVKTVD